MSPLDGVPSEGLRAAFDRIATGDASTTSPAADGQPATPALPPHADFIRGGGASDEPPARPATSSRLDAAMARALSSPAGGDALDGARRTDTTGGGAADAARGPTATVHVYDGSRPTADGRASWVGSADDLARGDGPRNAQVAARNVQRGLDWLHESFGRDGVDGAGSAVKLVVNDRTRTEDGSELFEGNGGYYSTPDENGRVHEAIRFGRGSSQRLADGRRLDRLEMLHADDLSIHELMHGVIRAETGRIGGTADELGATNEAVADVLAAAATRDWRIGEGMYADSSSIRLMRNLADPDDPSAQHGLWTSVAEVEARAARGEEVEEHYASGIISTAAARIQQRLGGEAGWRAVEHLFYAALDNDRLGDMGFADVASGLRSVAAESWGRGSREHLAVDAELRAAGL